MPRAEGGFTLIELVLVIIIISIGLLALASMFGNNMRTLAIGEDTQRAAQYGQECAERVLAVRRDFGFDSPIIGTTICDSISLTNTGFARSVTVPTTYTGTTMSACPNLGTCRDVTVTVSKGTVSSQITLMLVK